MLTEFTALHGLRILLLFMGWQGGPDASVVLVVAGSARISVGDVWRLQQPGAGHFYLSYTPYCVGTFPSVFDSILQIVYQPAETYISGLCSC